MKLRRPLAAALARAVLLGTVALPPLTAPAVAVAQASQPDRTVFAVRFLGEWVDNYGLKYVFTEAGYGRITGVVTRPATGETVATIDWGPDRLGMGGNFRVPGQNPADPASDRGITGYVDHEGEASLFVRSGRFPNGHQAQAHPDKGPGSKGYEFNLRRPKDALAVNERNWKGRWRTSRGMLEFRNDGHGMFGSLKSGNPLTPVARVALRGDPGGVAFGAWEKEGVWSATVDRGDVWLQQSADGMSFRGYYTEVNGSGARRIDWTGERFDLPQTPAQPAPSQPTDRTPAFPPSHHAEPPAGNERANAEAWVGIWKVIGSNNSFIVIESAGGRVTARAVEVEPGKTTPDNSDPVIVDSARTTTRRLRAALVVESGATVNIEALLQADGRVARATGVENGRPVAFYMQRVASFAERPRSPEGENLIQALKGPWITPLGQLALVQRDDELHATVRDAQGRTHVFTLEESLGSRYGFEYKLEGRYDLEGLRVSVGPDGKSFQIVGEEPFDRPFVALRMGEEDLVRGPLTNPSPAPPAGGGTSRPQPPAPEPGAGAPPAQPGSPPTQPAPSAPGFKPLNRVDVRVDRVVVARGYPTHQVHAFVTVKNTSETPQHFGSGFLKVTLADADGVSWERSEPYRATGEPADGFMSTPVIQPGGELKVRYIFLSDPDARLTSLTFVDGPKRAEFRPAGGL